MRSGPLLFQSNTSYLPKNPTPGEGHCLSDPSSGLLRGHIMTEQWARLLSLYFLILASKRIDHRKVGLTPSLAPSWLINPLIPIFVCSFSSFHESLGPALCWVLFCRWVLRWVIQTDPCPWGSYTGETTINRPGWHVRRREVLLASMPDTCPNILVFLFVLYLAPWYTEIISILLPPPSLPSPYGHLIAFLSRLLY